MFKIKNTTALQLWKIFNLILFALTFWFIYIIFLFLWDIYKNLSINIYNYIIIILVGIIITTIHNIIYIYLHEKKISKKLKRIFKIFNAFFFVSIALLIIINLNHNLNNIYFFIPIYIILSFVIYYSSYKLNNLRIRIKMENAKKVMQLLPKALILDDKNFTYQYMNSLTTIKKAYKKSLKFGDNTLQYLNYKISVLSDPRIYSKIELSIALNFLIKEIELRKKLYKQNISLKVKIINNKKTNLMIEPIILISCGIFIVEYGIYKKNNIEIELKYENKPTHCIRFKTNIDINDMWFNLNLNSSANNAKINFMEILNKYNSTGILYESDYISGNLVFSLYPTTELEEKDIWNIVEEKLPDDVKLIYTSPYNNCPTRVYSNSDTIYKVHKSDSYTVKSLVLFEEYKILQLLNNIKGITTNSKYTKYPNFAILSYNKISGMPIGDYIKLKKYKRSYWFAVIAKLSNLLNNIHSRGVLHRDLRSENILVGKDGKIHLIDFDQAIANSHDMSDVDILGLQNKNITPCYSINKLLNNIGIREDYDKVVKILKQAWKIAETSKASSPNKTIAYYNFKFGENEFNGERNWYIRWNIIQKHFIPLIKSKRILNLGCNMGLLATHCMLNNAESVTAIDVEKDILKAGELISKAAGVQVKYIKGDLNSKKFVDSIRENKYEIVIALSVIHWLNNPNPIYKLLSESKYLLFEGHDSSIKEIEKLKQLGFSNIQIIGYSERLRALYLCSKK